ncbi:MAG: YnbE family lipoprotein [Parvularculaceae bacterium]
MRLALIAPFAAALIACNTVKLEGGDKPIEVNLNVNVSGEVLVKLDREIDDAIAQNPDIF